jgi:hypothetical protein
MASFVTFRNYLRVQVPTYINSLQSKWVSAYGAHPIVVPYEKLTPEIQLELNHTTKPLMDCFDQELNAKQPLSQESKQLMFDTAYFSRSGYDFHPWGYLKAKKVNSLDIFSMLTNTNPFGMGVGNYRNFQSSEIPGQWEQLKSKGRGKWVFLDYWNGIGLKMSLPKDLEELSPVELDASVDYRKYDDRNSMSFASVIGKLSQPQLDTNRVSTEAAITAGLAKTMTDWKSNM